MEAIEDTQKKEYILHYILRPSMSPEQAHQYRATLNEKIQAGGGEVKASLCQERTQRLAYPLQREASGFFCESVFLFEPEQVPALSRDLKHEPEVLRYLIEHKAKRGQLKFRKQLRRVPGEEGLSRKVPPTPAREEKRKSVSMEEIDRKLDEIIKNI